MERDTARVLIVDDMPINRIVLASHLANQGVLSDQVDNGRDCIELCKKKDYDLILMDHRMPDLDGVDTLVLLKDIFKENKREVPVICHTTEEGRNNINLYKAAGFADVLIKPLDPKELSDVLLTYLKNDDNNESKDNENFIKEIEHKDRQQLDEAFIMNELDILPIWLKSVPHLDLPKGISNCGSAEDYMDALYIFYSSIEEKSSEIKNYMENNEWTMYALRVHSLKSMARLIGAREISENAADLEESSKNEDFIKVKNNTDLFLENYREFLNTLSPIENEGNLNVPSKTESDTNAIEENPDLSRNVLFVQSGDGIVSKGLKSNLEDAGFFVIPILDEPDLIIIHRNEADIVLYYPGLNDSQNMEITMNILGEICQDDGKILCITGDMIDIEKAMLTNGAHRVSKSYPRPVDIEHFIRDMEYFSELEREYHEKKTIFVVDDDDGYLSIIDRWLSPYYNVSTYETGDDIIDGLNAIIPDLILLDYEMPEMDGLHLMHRIRTSFSEYDIPIIFLTGKNERDLVFHVLECKPDGYLLKTSQKEAILDAIRRFFIETLYRKTL